MNIEQAMSSRYDFILPNSSTTLLQAQRCGKCGHLLPDTLLYHIVTPASDREIREAVLSGTLNSRRCVYCDFLGFFAASAWIALPRRNRQIFILPRSVVIPNIRPIKQRLYELAGQYDPACEVYCKLPSQTAESCFDVPNLLNVPDDVVEYEQLAEEQLIARLPLTPDKRAARFVSEKVNLFESLVAMAISSRNVDKRSVEIAHVTFRSAFERTKWGLRAIISEVNKVITHNADNHIVQLLIQMREGLTSTYKEKWGELDDGDGVELPPNLTDALGALDGLMSEQHDSVDISKMPGLPVLIRRLHALGQDEMALDLANYYLHYVSPEDSVYETLEVLLLFGVLVERTGEWRHYSSWEYLSLAASNLPNRGESNNPQALFMAALAREYLIPFYRREHNQHAALAMSVEAAELYMDAGRTKEARIMAENAISLGRDLHSHKVIQRAREVLGQLTNEKSSVNDHSNESEILAEIQAQMNAMQDSEQITIRDAVFNVLPPGKEWEGGIIEGYIVPYGSVVMKKIPINYNPKHQLSLYDRLTADIEVYCPYNEDVFKSLTSSKDLRVTSITLRVWERNGDGLELMAEEILKHPLLTWVEKGEDEEEQRARYLKMRPTLWNWAGNRERVRWLLAEYATRINKTGENSGPLSVDESLGFGFAFGALCRRSTTHGTEQQHWLAREVLKLIGDLVEANGEGLRDKVSPGNACEARSVLAGACEVVGDINRAYQLYEINIRAALLARRGGEDLDARIGIQSMAGADLGRYLRTSLRRSEWRLSELELKRIC